MNLTAERIALLDEDYALVDRMLLDEARSALSRSRNPTHRRLADAIEDYMNGDIAQAVEAQDEDYAAVAEARHVGP